MATTFNVYSFYSKGVQAQKIERSNGENHKIAYILKPNNCNSNEA